MKGEFVVSSFCKGGACTVQVKHNTTVVIVGGKNNGRLPFGLLAKGIIKVFVKEYPPVYTLKHWWIEYRAYRKIRRALLTRYNPTWYYNLKHYTLKRLRIWGIIRRAPEVTSYQYLISKEQ